MFTAVAVEEADEATGNPHSLAITSSDRSVHFVRGACREEAKSWKDVLTSYMRHTTQVSFLMGSGCGCGCGCGRGCEGEGGEEG